MNDWTEKDPGSGREKLPPETLRAVNSFVHQFGAALGVLTLYPPGHRALLPAREALFRRLQPALSSISPLVLAVSQKEILLEGRTPLTVDIMSERFRDFFQRLGVAIISFDPAADREALEAFLDFAIGVRQRLSPEILEEAGVFPGISLSLVDYSQVLSSDGKEEGEMSPEEKNRKLWEALVADFLGGDRESLGEKEMLDLISLMEEERVFAERIGDLLGNDPSREAVSHLGRLMDLALEFMVGNLRIGEEEALGKVKKCLMALPERIRVSLMDLPSLGTGEGGAVNRVIRNLSLEEVAGLLASTISVGTSAARRLANILSLLTLDDPSRERLLPMITGDLERRSGRRLGGEDLRRIQKFLSPSSDKFVSESYGHLLEMGSREKESAASEEEMRTVLELVPELAPEKRAGAIFPVLMESLFTTEREKLFTALRAELLGMLISSLDEGHFVLAAEGLTMIAEAAADTQGERQVRRAGSLAAMIEEVLTEETVRAVVRGARGLGEEQLGAIRRILLLVPKPAVKVLTAALAEEDSQAVRRFLVSGLAQLGQLSKPEALGMLKDGRPQVVRNMLTLLGEIGDDQTVPHIAPHLGHPDRRVRKEAVLALIGIGTPNAMKSLLGALEDPEEEIVQQAAMHLSARGDGAALLRLLLQHVERSNPLGMRDSRIRGAILALGRIKAVEAVPRLRAILMRRRWLVPPGRRHELATAAAVALAGIDSAESRKALEEGLLAAAGPVARVCGQLLERSRK